MPSIPKGTTDVQFSPIFSNYSDWVVEDRRKHDADWIDEQCDEDYADYTDCIVEDRLEDYAPRNPEEERLARNDVDVSIVRTLMNIYQGEI
jgi:hypothetical protein